MSSALHKMELRSQSILLILLLFISPFLLSLSRVNGDNDDEGEEAASPTSSSPCPATLALPASVSFPFSTNNFSCNSAWSAQNFVLMYQNTGPSLWSFVLTAPANIGGYISVGFSPDGAMVGADAIAGWIPSGGAGIVKQYHLAGKTSSSCQPDTGNLKLKAKSTAIVSQSSKLYMGFQLETDTPGTKLIYAYGSAPKSDNLLPLHGNRTSTTVDYSSGQNSSSSSSPSPPTGTSNVSTACSSSLNLNSSVANFNTSGLNCVTAWDTHDFTLFYKQSEAELWSFVLSTPDSNAYVSIGFSSNGRMVGSSAIAGWKTGSGVGVAKQYYLGGTGSGSECPPDKGDLVLVGSPVVVLQSSRLYLVFQLNTSQPLSNLIYAIGPQGTLPGSDNILSTHSDAVSTSLDYSLGQSLTTSSSTNTLKTAHGILGLLGWGVLVPIGVMVARYGKGWDPLWFYSHISIQGAGFALGIACIFTGISLEDKVDVDVDMHKVIGVIISIMGILQVLAVCARPNKTSKIRKYWNWYHHNVGRIAIVLGICNIFYGISLAHEDSSWNVGFGVFLGILFVANVGLEAWFRLRHQPI